MVAEASSRLSRVGAKLLYVGLLLTGIKDIKVLSFVIFTVTGDFGTLS